jgi:hypothetical protein
MLRISGARNFNGFQRGIGGEVGKMWTMLSGWFGDEWGLLSVGERGVASLKGLAITGKSERHITLEQGRTDGQA